MLERIKILESNVEHLKVLQNSQLEDKDFFQNKTNEWALRYGLLESIQIIIDIGCHLVSKYNLGTPESYKQCFLLLEKFEYLDSELSQKCIKMAGLRNILSHEYIKINLPDLIQMLSLTDDFIKFIKSIYRYLE